MGYGSTIIMILLFVNIVIFLGSQSLGRSDINTPIISILISVAQGNTLQLIPTLSAYIGSAGTVLGLIILGMVALSVATGSNYLTSGGGYGVTQAPMLIGLFIFLSLALIPNFNVMGFPSLAEGIPLAEIVYAIFGLMVAIGTYGVIRGE